MVSARSLPKLTTKQQWVLKTIEEQPGLSEYMLTKLYVQEFISPQLKRGGQYACFNMLQTLETLLRRQLVRKVSGRFFRLYKEV